MRRARGGWSEKELPSFPAGVGGKITVMPMRAPAALITPWGSSHPAQGPGPHFSPQGPSVPTPVTPLQGWSPALHSPTGPCPSLALALPCSQREARCLGLELPQCPQMPGSDWGRGMGPGCGALKPKQYPDNKPFTYSSATDSGMKYGALGFTQLLYFAHTSELPSHSRPLYLLQWDNTSIQKRVTSYFPLTWFK